VRRAKAEEAKAELAKAVEAGDQEVPPHQHLLSIWFQVTFDHGSDLFFTVSQQIEKFGKRTVRVSKEQNDDCKKLLRLMGMPVVEAPCEAEAQCAELAKGGVVYATATEDMDALTFGTPILLRHFTMSEARKMPIQQFNLKEVLEELGFSMDEFVELCIMLGCDYAGTVKGVGQVKALELLRKYRSVDAAVASLDKAKYTVPETLLEEVRIAREEFLGPEVLAAKDVELKWGECDADGLVQFLVTEKQFSEERVKNNIAKLQKMKKGTTQGRLDTFFKTVPTSGPSAATKRKQIAADKNKAAKKAKGSSWGKKKK